MVPVSGPELPPPQGLPWVAPCLRLRRGSGFELNLLTYCQRLARPACTLAQPTIALPWPAFLRFRLYPLLYARPDRVNLPVNGCRFAGQL